VVKLQHTKYHTRVRYMVEFSRIAFDSPFFNCYSIGGNGCLLAMAKNLSGNMHTAKWVSTEWPWPGRACFGIRRKSTAACPLPGFALHRIVHGHLSPDGTVASVATGGLAALGQSDGGFEHHRFATWAAGATGRHPHPGIMRRVLDVLILHPGSLILRSRVIYQFILPRGREGSKFVCIADPILQLLDGNNCAPAIPTFALTFNYGVRGRYG